MENIKKQDESNGVLINYDVPVLKSIIISDPIQCITIKSTVEKLIEDGRNVVDVCIHPGGYKILVLEKNIVNENDPNIIKVKPEMNFSGLFS